MHAHHDAERDDGFHREVAAGIAKGRQLRAAAIREGFGSLTLVIVRRVRAIRARRRTLPILNMGA